MTTATLTPSDQAQVNRILRGRERLLGFAAYTFTNYQEAEHLQLVASALEDIEAGRNDRLMVFIDSTVDPDGANYLGTLQKTTPGTNQVTHDWDIAGVPDAQYFLFAELIPDAGADGIESQATTPRAGRNNTGNGTFTLDTVATNEVVTSGGILGTVVGFKNDAVVLKVDDQTKLKVQKTAITNVVNKAAG